MKMWTVTLLVVAVGAAGSVGRAQDSHTLLAALLANEQGAAAHRGRYEYMSGERSDRTGSHLWTEKVIETPQGRVRLLLAEDGKPITPDRAVAERNRLTHDAQHPEAFAQQEAAHANDEQHAKQMLALLPKAYLFDAPEPEGEYVRIHYRPNPDYQPASMEERVLHGMTGSVVIDRQMVRLREVDGRLKEDVSLGFGPFAIIKAGSYFATQREHVEGQDWKTETVDTDIIGRALMLKSLARKQQLKRWDYKRTGDSLTVAQAVELIER